MLATLAALAAGRPARAQLGWATPPPSSEDRPSAIVRAWDVQRPRAFLASTVDLGFLYVRPRLSAGYGRPHALWLGVEGNPIAAGSGVGGFVGVRASGRVLDLRVGARGFYAFERGFLPPLTHFERIDLERASTSHATTMTYEVELTSGGEVGPGELHALTSLSYVDGVPAGQDVFEETLRVIARPPWVWRARAGYGFFVPTTAGALSVGPVVDVLAVPRRGAVVVRAGVVARVVLSEAFELRGTFVPTVASPDAIGLVGSDFTELGLRWRWATR